MIRSAVTWIRREEKMKFRIDKLPKSDEDLEEIQREVESTHSHEHEHHHHGEEELESIIGELYANYQNLQARVQELEEQNEKYRKEISTLYELLKHSLRLSTASDQAEKSKILREILAVLDNES
ncbi:hypothetical protein MetMK1DRAFT_00031870 [Metallosphaera yellowstonensis MK1]|jgi:uncharacterized Ntn-hydrolase superfamily protein|uniref:Uncharacterized protein n=2 Tax=Metallosphaera TaxID=41980 RepID=H2C9B6_9CREN|nr:hypothetical protein MetMK1DRAFT_00031870 [Metallosphaera yellowstonensis MK1]